MINFTLLEFIGLLCIIELLVFFIMVFTYPILYSLGATWFEIRHINLKYVYKNKLYFKLFYLPFLWLFENFIEGLFNPVTLKRSSKLVWKPFFNYEVYERKTND